MERELAIALFFLPKLTVSLFCGILVGWDRERGHKDAGIKDLVFFSTGVTLFTALAFWIHATMPVTDPTRILGQVITGLGFIGAGVIFKHDDKIRGITTATMIWFCSAVGMMVGYGLYLLPVILAIGTVILSFVLDIIEDLLKKDGASRDRDSR